MRFLLLGNVFRAVLQDCHFSLMHVISFPVYFIIFRMDFGIWTENSRGIYNKWDGVARSTIQVNYVIKY